MKKDNLLINNHLFMFSQFGMPFDNNKSIVYERKKGGGNEDITFSHH